MVQSDPSGPLVARATALVWIDLKGAPKALIAEFLDWQREREIFPAVRAGRVGNGALSNGFFFGSDAEAVIEWLESKGIRVDRE